MASGTLEAKVVSNQVAQFAAFFRAYIECKPEVQQVIQELSAIVESDEATQEEREYAVSVMVEALFPGLAADTLETHRGWLSSEDTAKERQEVDNQEVFFGDKVRQLMTEKNISQELLAERVGVGQPAISNILNRKCRPQQKTIAKVATALGVSPSELWPACND